jgi:hypothetical protein
LPMLAYFGKGLSVLLVFFLVGSAAPAFSIGFNAFWQYRESGGDGIDTRRDFQQRYSLGVGQGLTFQPTRTISLGGNFGYARTDQDLGQGMTTVETYTPSAFLSLTNDIFFAGLSGLVNERRSDAGSFTNRAWNAALSSAWRHELWPNLRLNYSEGTDTGDARGVTLFDTENKQYSFGFDWDLYLAKLFYDYSNSRSEDLISGSGTDGESHFARVETRRSIWRNRIVFNLAQQYQQSSQDVSVLIPEDDTFLARLQGGQTLSAVVDPLAVSDPEEVLLNPNPQLQNRILFDDPAVNVNTDQPERRVHLGISFPLDQQIDELHLYIDQLESLGGDQLAALRWDLYTRDLLDSTWELNTPDIPVTFDDDAGRIALGIGLLDRQVKVVATVPIGLRLVVTELEAMTSFTGDSTSRQKSYLTNAGLRVQLTRTLAASSTLVLERTESEFETVLGVSEGESKRRTVSGGLSWTPAPYIRPSLGISETRLSQTGNPEEMNRSYSLLVATYPIPTLNVSFGATRADRFSDAQKIGTTDTFSLISTARIYPDLTASLNNSYALSDRLAPDDTIISTNIFNSRLTLNARINPALTADLTTNYRHAETEGAASTSSLDSRFSLLYRPSDLLAMRLTGSTVWSGPDAPDTLIYNLTMALLRTANTRVNFRYSHNRGMQTSNTYGLSGSWDINRALTLQNRIDYRSAERDSWSFLVSLALRL